MQNMCQMNAKSAGQCSAAIGATNRAGARDVAGRTMAWIRAIVTD
jgi:hypothetical protein